MVKVNYRKASKDQASRNSKAPIGESPKKPTDKQRSGMIFQPYDPTKRMQSYEAVKADLLQKIGKTFTRPIDVKQSLTMMKKVEIQRPELQETTSRASRLQHGV
jgi:ABC-type phosphate/phosphonate transport system ATPase subunit